MGLQMEQMIPFAAGHEIMRQRKKDLRLIGPISDVLFDQIIGVILPSPCCTLAVGIYDAVLVLCGTSLNDFNSEFDCCKFCNIHFEC